VLQGTKTGQSTEEAPNFRELRKVEIQLPRIPKRRSSQNSYSTH
jgi:hypothetical protein